MNGKIVGNRIESYIDWSDPNPSAFGLQGAKFTGYVFGGDHRAMAGSVLGPAGNTWAFTAFKGRTLTGVPSNSASLAAGTYGGSWQLDTDGARGTLDIAVDGATREMFGSFTDKIGAVFIVSGQMEPDPRAFHFTIHSAAAPSYIGHLNGHQLGVMSGASVSSGVTVGFYAVRVGEVPLAVGLAQPVPIGPFECGLTPHLPQMGTTWMVTTPSSARTADGTTTSQTRASKCGPRGIDNRGSEKSPTLRGGPGAGNSRELARWLK